MKLGRQDWKDDVAFSSLANWFCKSMCFTQKVSVKRRQAFRRDAHHLLTFAQILMCSKQWKGSTWHSRCNVWFFSFFLNKFFTPIFVNKIIKAETLQRRARRLYVVLNLWWKQWKEILLTCSISMIDIHI